jgi:hypothetical protein
MKDWFLLSRCNSNYLSIEKVTTKRAGVELGRMRKTRLQRRSESSTQRRFQQLERVRGI